MNSHICPNVSSKEWKDNVEKFGEKESWRDFIENGTIRDTDEIEQKFFSVNMRYDKGVPLKATDNFTAAVYKNTKSLVKDGVINSVSTFDSAFSSSPFIFQYDSSSKKPSLLVDNSVVDSEKLFSVGMAYELDVLKDPSLLKSDTDKLLKDSDLVSSFDKFKNEETLLDTFNRTRNNYFRKKDYGIDINDTNDGLIEFFNYRSVSKDVRIPYDSTFYPEYFDTISPDQLASETFSVDDSIDFASELSRRIGVDFEFISKEQAIEMTKDSPDRWNGNAGFFMGKVYFVGSSFSKGTILHEFAHPFVRSIRIDNREVFDKIVGDLLSTSEGAVLYGDLMDKMNEKYDSKTIDELDDFVKEELIVRSLEKMSDKSSQKSSGFISVVKEFLYHVKRLLRDLFGKNISISNLSSDTSLEELYDILSKGGKIRLNSKVFGMSDVISYTDKVALGLLGGAIGKAKRESVQSSIGVIRKRVVDTINSFVENEEFDELLKYINESEGRDVLGDINKGLSSVDISLRKAEDFVKKISNEGVEDMRLADSLLTIDYVLSSINKVLERSIDKVDTDERTMRVLYSYGIIVDSWKKMIDDVSSSLMGDNVSDDFKPLTDLVSDISESVRKFDVVRNKMSGEVLSSFIMNEMKSYSDDVNKRYNEIREFYLASGMPQSVIDKLDREYDGLDRKEKKEYEELKRKLSLNGSLKADELKRYSELRYMYTRGLTLDEEKIKMMLDGNSKDIGFFNSRFEARMYSNDSVVGGLSLMLKDAYAKANTTMMGYRDEFFGVMKPYLDILGYNAASIGKFGRDLGFRDIVYVRDSRTGEYKEKEVLTFMNPFKNYRADRERLSIALKEARDNYLSGNGSIDDFVEAQKEYDEFDKLMNRKYTDEYYNVRDGFMKDRIGAIALAEMERLDNLIEEAKSLLFLDEDNQQYLDNYNLLKIERRKLSSLYDIHGVEKVVGSDEYEVAMKVKEISEAFSGMYDINTSDSFDRAYERFVDKVNEEVDDPDIAKNRVDDWLRKNTKSEMDPSILKRNNTIRLMIEDITKKYGGSMTLSESYKKLFDLLSGFNSPTGEYLISYLNEDIMKSILALETSISRMDSREDDITRMSVGDMMMLDDYDNDMGDVPRKTIDVLLKKRDEARKIMGKDYDTYVSLKLELASGSSGSATLSEEYLYNLNQNFGDSSYYQDFIKTNGDIDSDNISKFLSNQKEILDYLSKDKDKQKWFFMNHFVKDKKTFGLSIVNKVNRKKGNYVIRDTDGNPIRTIEGVPSNEYENRTIKDEYLTKKIVGVTVDNKGAWLPKTVENGGSSRYRNDAYYNMKRDNPHLFEALEKVTEVFLKRQSDMDVNDRLYLDFPRERMKGIESVGKGVTYDFDNGKSFFTKYWRRMEDFFIGAKDDANFGFNDKDSQYLTTAMTMNVMNDSRIKVSSLYDIDVDDVSTDIVTTMMKYFYSAEEKRELKRINPFARTLQRYLNENLNSINKGTRFVNSFREEKDDDVLTDSGNYGVSRVWASVVSKKGRLNRVNSVNAIVNTFFEGEKSIGFGTHGTGKVINKLIGLLGGASSKIFFSYDIFSGAKNAMSIRYQSMIDASGGKHQTHYSAVKGEAWASKAMVDLSFGGNLYGVTSTSLTQHIIEAYDMIQGRTKEKFGEGLTRSRASDLFSGSVPYSIRKWMEMEASLQVSSSILYNVKVKMFEGTEKEKTVSMMDIWEMKDGKISLKTGVDPKYGITYDESGRSVHGSEFTRVRNLIHQKSNDLQGNYSFLDQPEMNRYMFYRIFASMRKYFTPMLMRRFAVDIDMSRGITKTVFRPRADFGKNEPTMGYWFSTAVIASKFVSDSFNMRSPLKRFTREDFYNLRLFGADILKSIILDLIIKYLLGFDMDDPDKYKKLKANSGPIPFFSIDGDPEFSFSGYASNVALLNALYLRQEGQQFIPFPGKGLESIYQQYVTGFQPIAIGPGVTAYVDVLSDLYHEYEGDPKIHERRVGNMWYQRAGEKKIYGDLFKVAGFKFREVSPEYSIQTAAQLQTLYRK